MNKQVPTPLYKKILEAVPVLTVDVLIVDRNKFLLVKRKQHPAKGKWWTPGGRVLWGERVEDAAIRKAKDETGIDVKIQRMLGIAHFVFRKGAQGTRVHTPSVFFLARPVRKDVAIRLDRTSAGAEWFSHIPKGSHPETVKMLRHAGFR